MANFAVVVKFEEEPVVTCKWQLDGEVAVCINDNDLVAQQPDTLWRARQLLKDAEFRVLLRECALFLRKFEVERLKRDPNGFPIFGFVWGDRVFMEIDGDLVYPSCSKIGEEARIYLEDWARRAQTHEKGDDFRGLSLVSSVG